MQCTFILFALISSFHLHADDSFNYKDWWETWYRQGGTSGSGSRGVLAQFKADVINDFIREKKIKSAIEFGCGDGYNLGKINYETYVGLDVSLKAIELCKNMFKGDGKKNFFFYEPHSFSRNAYGNFDVVVCLDVLYHVISEKEFQKTLDAIFSFSSPYVIIYTTLYNEHNSPDSPEILHRAGPFN
jgi:2-polyprenyl-3-methyl-5-hydroxy-6-metoxy-1,4-benzoquinol methylase